MQVVKNPSKSQVSEPYAASLAVFEELLWQPVFFRESQGEFVQEQFA
jgi:hypothetical protein